MSIRKRFLSVLALLLALVLAAPAYAAMTSEEKDERYRAAVLELETYLESYGMNGTSLEGIEGMFGSLGGYSQSRCMYYYTQVLEKLAADDYGYDLDSLLSLLEKNERFGEYLSGPMKDSAIMPVTYLSDYAAGRRKEYSGDVEGALEEYEKCLGFFDADQRYVGIKYGVSESVFRDAVALLDGGNFAGAYYAFDRADRGAESEERKASIVYMLGYTPADADDNPGPVTGLQASIPGAGQITLTWNAAAHAVGYEVAYRRSGAQNWTVSETTANTTATIAGLAMDTYFDFRVTAIVGQKRPEYAELLRVRTATPTPTPLVLQAVTGLSVQKTEPTAVSLSWNRVAYAQRYRVMIRNSGEAGWFETAATNATSVQITQLFPATEYQFMIVAENGSVYSESGTITAKTAAATPTPLALQPANGLSVQRTDQTSILLSWNSVPYAQAYRVMVKERSSSAWREGAYTGGTTAQITQLQPWTEYDLKVVAENGGVRSESGTVSARTEATPTPRPVEITVTVIYQDQYGNRLNTDYVTLKTSGNISANGNKVPSGYTLTGSGSAYISVWNGQADPSSVVFTYSKRESSNNNSNTSSNQSAPSVTTLSFSVLNVASGAYVPVYSAPSTSSWRGSNGKAGVSTNDTIYCAGETNGWLLVYYRLTAGANAGGVRAGYIRKNEVSVRGSVSGLNLSSVSATVNGRCALTDDPEYRYNTITTLSNGTRVTVLARYRSYAYIETTYNGQKVRGFVDSGSLSY